MYLDGMLANIDPVIESILQRILDKKQIDTNQLKELFKAKNGELNAICKVADFFTQKKFRNRVTYIINRNINYTNICRTGCTFCAFSKSSKSKEGYILTHDQIKKKLKEAKKVNATEVCIQGGINPQLDIYFLESLIRLVSDSFSGVHIHALSPMEIDYYSRKAKISYNESLSMLKEAGLCTIPGTAAEILNDTVRLKICPKKLKTENWIEIIKKAHKMGIKSTATILYGHVESYRDIISHFEIIRNIQKETRNFTEFIPLKFIDGNTLLKSKDTNLNSLDLKMIALSRLYFNDVIDNIQTSWVKLGINKALTMLNKGANDLGGTLFEENITSSASNIQKSFLTVSEIISLIKSVKKVPVQRDTLYNELRIN